MSIFTPTSITGDGTFTLATQAANQVFRGPTSGAAAVPSFGVLVIADMPAGVPTTACLTVANNLSDVASVPTARTNLGVPGLIAAARAGLCLPPMI